ncbi:MAG: GNAT family N-acetyltransferase [Gaiellales bacterium]
MTDVVVRERRPDDDAALSRLVAETVPQVDAAHEHLAAGVAPAGPPGDIVFVAEVGGHPAGFVAARESDRALLLDRMVIPPADQGRKVGHALLDWAEGYGTSRRLRQVAVPATGADERAVDFYRRRGYAVHGELLVRDLCG